MATLPTVPAVPTVPTLGLPPLPLGLPCIKLPTLPVPQLPSPFTIGITIPPFQFDPGLCCKVLPFDLKTPPIPLSPGVLNPAVVAVINQALTQMATYFDQFQFSCPIE